jgi:tRNA dimethylallyltransferase
MSRSKIIVIIGPTGSGKSALAIKIAKKFSGEIVSADSRQIYRQMNIGTAKPPKKEMAGIPHHLIDIKNPNEDYSVGQYKKDAVKAIDGIIKRGKLPILVGGTGLYISAILDNLEIPRIKENKKLRKKLEKEIANKGLAFVFKKLVAIDPEAAYIIDPKNPRRVIRALEIALVSGKKLSEQRKRGKSLYNALTIGLNPPTETYKKLVIKRTKKMMKEGLINEVKNLVKKYGYNCRAFDAIGYREIIDYLKKKNSLEEAISQMNRNTLRYAKRQMTWFKKYNPRAHWVKSPASLKLRRANKNEALGLVKKFLKI